MKKITVDDFEYFRAIDHLVREAMKRFEAKELLPIARQAVKDAGFELYQYPIEGYYDETEELKEYFVLIRNLQHKFTEKITPAIEKLHDVYTHPVFGLKQSDPTAISKRDGLEVMYPNEPRVTISPVADPVTVSSMKMQRGEWTIERIIDNIDRDNLGTGLVGFALSVDEKYDKYNPVATCLACETTVLSRKKAMARGMREKINVDWKVSPEVEAYGKRVIDAYNDLFKKHSERDNKISYVTPENAGYTLEDAPSMIRCVNLNIDAYTGRKDKYYHWGIVSDGEKYAVKEFWNEMIVGTKEWQQRHHEAPEYRRANQSRGIIQLQDDEKIVCDIKSGRVRAEKMTPEEYKRIRGK